MLVCWCNGHEICFNKLGEMIGYFNKVYKYLLREFNLVLSCHSKCKTTG